MAKQTQLSAVLDAQGKVKCHRANIGGQRPYLSADRTTAEQQIERLRAALQYAQAFNTVFDADTVKKCLTGVYSPPTVQVPTKPVEVPTTPIQAAIIMLHAAIGLYLADHKGKVSASRYDREKRALYSFQNFQKDMDLSAVTWDVLNGIVNHYRTRPDGKAVWTVRTEIAGIKRFFDWCDASGKWEGPRRWEKVFRVKWDSLKTPEELELEGEGVTVFSVDELATLWKAADQRQRLYMGLALNTGELAQGISNFVKISFKTDKQGNTVLSRHRTKTNNKGVYPLWKEVAEIARKEMDQNPAEPLAFKSAENLPLVRYYSKGRFDEVALVWRCLLRTCKGKVVAGRAKTGHCWAPQNRPVL